MSRKKLTTVSIELTRLRPFDTIATSNQWGVNSDKVGFGGGTTSFDVQGRQGYVWDEEEDY